jgi:hypothetical protein
MTYGFRPENWSWPCRIMAISHGGVSVRSGVREMGVPNLSLLLSRSDAWLGVMGDRRGYTHLQIFDRLLPGTQSPGGDRSRDQENERYCGGAIRSTT